MKIERHFDGTTAEFYAKGSRAGWWYAVRDSRGVRGIGKTLADAMKDLRHNYNCRVCHPITVGAHGARHA